MRTPLQIKSISYYINNICLFDDVSAILQQGQRIGIIGRNGSGKSTLLKLILKHINPMEGQIIWPKGLSVGYVPQLGGSSLEPLLSGGEYFQKKLHHELSKNPNLLCLDEPTNHLDQKNRSLLFKQLHQFPGTVIIITHDEEVLEHYIDEIWVLEDKSLKISKQSYRNYLKERAYRRNQAIEENQKVKQEKKKLHHALMKEQKRAKKTKAKGAKKYSGDKLTLSYKKQQGEKKSAHMQKNYTLQKDSLAERKSNLILSKEYMLGFDLKSSGAPIDLSIEDGACLYQDKVILKNIQLQLYHKECLLLKGDNGSGKSTFLKALMRDPSVRRRGKWDVPCLDKIGYLDQHYQMLSSTLTIEEIIQTQKPDFDDQEIRHYLNHYHFRSQGCYKLVSSLSGGERLRLCLAMLVLKKPDLLLLDEITNNIDLETKKAVEDMLKNYDGSIILISHDKAFTNKLDITRDYTIKRGLDL